MRVAILGSRGFPSTYSGYETLVRHLAPALRDRGWSVTVYCRTADVARPSNADVDVVDGITRVWTRGLTGKSTATLTHGFTSSRHAARERFDAVLVLNVANGYFLRRLRKAQVPTVVNVDGIEWERDKWSALGKAVFRHGARLVARHADAIVADSRAIGAYWERVFARPSTYIPYGADIHTDVPDDRLAEVGVRPGSYVLVIARIVPENNVAPFLDAVELLDGQTPVVVVGSAVGRSALEDRLRSLVKVRPSFHWLGHVSDQELLRQLRAHCGVYWHGHSVGGTNPSLLEAMACGAPVVAVDTVYNREVIGDAGMFSAARGEPIATRLAMTLTEEAQRDALSSAAKQTISLRYGWRAVADGYISALKSCANNGR